MIEFEEVSKTYGRPGRAPAALRAISFRIEEGEFALLMGPSGAGKSTLLKLILAMETPDCGHICVAGRDVHRLTRASIPYLRRNLGAVFQDFRLIEQATPSENVALALHVLGMRPREVRVRVEAALARVGLDPDCKKPVRQLSGGEQQRVALARALAGDPPVLLADEPTGNLDPSLTMEIVECLQQIQSQGTTILLATHDPIVRDHLDGSRLLYLEAGTMRHGLVERRRLRSATGEEAAVVVGASPEASGEANAEGRSQAMDDAAAQTDAQSIEAVA